jgi:hypothetical protein
MMNRTLWFVVFLTLSVLAAGASKRNSAEFSNRDLHDYVAAGGVPSMMRGDDEFLRAPLLFDPGARWEYGISTDWLGRIVEKIWQVESES